MIELCVNGAFPARCADKLAATLYWSRSELDVCKRGIAIAVFLLAVIFAGQARAESAERVRFHIPAGPAATTLRRFASQSNMNVLFQSDEVSTQRTRAVSGRLEPIEALTRMLRGSGLRYQFQEPDSILVRAVERGVPSYGGVCGEGGSAPCEIVKAEGMGPVGPIVTVLGMSIDAVFGPGEMHVVEPYLTLTQQDFVAGGFQTVGEVLRSLPQNFGGGLNVGVIFAGGSQNMTPLSAASTVNLRGLGSGSTLVLINGQRVATAEGSGAVDVSLIPLSAVERIEITAGSASAVYGSDAVAGVVNIVVRTDFQGVELAAARGITHDSGNSLQHYSAVAGQAFEDVSVFAGADCVWQSDIDAQQRKYIAADLNGTTLMPGIQRCSTLFSAKGSLSQDLEGSVFGAYTTRSVFQQQSLTFQSYNYNATSTTRSYAHQYAVNAVLQQHLPYSWTATLSGGLSTDNVSSERLLTQTGAAEQYADDLLDNRLWTAQLVASGPLFETRAGAAQLTFGAGYNRQGFVFSDLSVGGLNVDRGRGVRFAFAESAFPLIGPTAGAKDPALSLDVAVRTERYSGVGKTTNKKFALTFRPISDIKAQASWGTSFRAPLLLQQFNTPQAALEFVPDPTLQGGHSLALLRFGGNPQVKPEMSADAELDLALTPEFLPGASLQVTYYNIFYRQRIDYPTLNTADPLSDPNIAPFVLRNPSAASITQIVAQSQFLDLTGGRFAAQDATLLIDDRNQNFVRQRASGVDLLWKYDCDTPIGRLSSSLNFAYLKLQQQVTNETAYRPLSGTVFYPPVRRGRFGLNWSYSRYLASFFVNYTGGSSGVSSTEPPQVETQSPIGQWTTLDAQIGMVFRGAERWGDTKLTLSGQNVANRHPPLISGNAIGPASINYDSTNASPVGRFLTLELVHVW